MFTGVDPGPPDRDTTLRDIFRFTVEGGTLALCGEACEEAGEAIVSAGVPQLQLTVRSDNVVQVCCPSLSPLPLTLYPLWPWL